jgi:hypothetical protein
VTAGATPESWWSTPSEGYEVVQRGSAQIAGRTATRIVFEYSPADDPDSSVRGLLYLFQRNQQAWAIDCETDSSHFQTEVSTFEGIAKSFKFDR